MRICRWCGQPIVIGPSGKGWAHALPLAAFQVSVQEAAAVHADPPRAGEPLHRPTVIHPAQPAAVYTLGPDPFELPKEATA